jgi:hypothetical protein
MSRWLDSGVAGFVGFLFFVDDFFLAHAGEGLKVSVGMVGIVETSF